MAEIVRSNVKGALLALVCFGIYATHDVVVKWLGATYSPVQVLFFSVTLGFPIVTVMLMTDREMDNLRPRHPWWTALRTLCTTLTGVSAFYAFSVLPLTQTYAILFASPLLITILAIPILGETVRFRRWAAVIVGLIGVLIVLRPGQAELSLGHLAAVAAAICGATASVIVRKIGQNERSAVLLLYPMVANFVVMGAALPFYYEPMPGLHLGGFALIAALGFIGSMLIIAAYRTGEAVVVAPMQYSQILWASAYGYFLFDEKPDGATAIGAAVIIASGIYIVVREGRVKVSEYRPVLRTRGRGEVGTAPRSSILERLRFQATGAGR
ncbi:DMT family transporter [Ostreiculturibacter nitratireducens]|uniref:DMT family transporter n=1 Tax=Ostreiculturibacter nitratireducens TaxID=3075226 RepID=UPI0031B5BDB3